ncbi:MAG TPA: TraB/GumN family protein [Cyclobacteriaceae bacterium]|nr:TraB/GumN family protein [Cyclobacteriaceae bacterium]
MKKHILRLSVILLALALAIPQGVHAQRDTDGGIFWEVSGNGLTRPSYLFGTYHLLSGAYLKKLPRVEAAFEGASGVVVESEIDSSKIVQMFSMLVMKDKKLSDLVSEDDYQLVADEIQKSTGTPMELMAQFKPAFITVMLTVTYARAAGSSEPADYEGPPLDAYFASTGREKKKAVSTFETMEEQMSLLFDHYTVEEQAKQLVDFVKSKEEMVTVQDDLLSLYLRHDLDGLYKLYQKYEKRFGDTSWLLDERNVNWMKQLPAMLAEGDKFIAVGALHLAGEKGLVELLRKQGYTVTARRVK